jgi:hypothetical protein
MIGHAQSEHGTTTVLLQAPQELENQRPVLLLLPGKAPAFEVERNSAEAQASHP